MSRRAWSAAFARYAAADSAEPLAPGDLEQFALVAVLIGKVPESVEILSRAHQAYLAERRVADAARCAFWIGFRLMSERESAQAGGWLARARRLADEAGDCVEQGWLLVPEAIRMVHNGDPAEAYGLFVEAGAIAKRHANLDLMTLSVHGQGRALIRSGDSLRGTALLDEAMVAVTAGEVSPAVAGALYCSVLEACQEMKDMARAGEWTEAFATWCSSQPELVPFRGECQMNRSDVLLLRGEWARALAEATAARDRLAGSAPRAARAAAHYRIAEIARLRGEFAAAETAYADSARDDPAPRPGLARLRLAEGRVAEAEAAIRRVADEVHDRKWRPVVLEARVEIALAAGDPGAARAAADELAVIAARLEAPVLRAAASFADGMTRLGAGDARGAVAPLREAWSLWSELEAPYERARARVALALACRELGDADGARRELEAARDEFATLGAVPDRARVDALLGPVRRDADGPLSPRERDVLALIATGLTNRDIGKRLFISEKTVARHVSNIFVKLDLSSRAAATAYAYQHDLVRPTLT
ncbi:MAG TPA: response regulator transcription factor [Candidatus Saccharimonadaceae bacterium]|nr:response regulator transcription factor [Candidatus Saccharimonadaceae bacterium]